MGQVHTGVIRSTFEEHCTVSLIQKRHFWGDWQALGEFLYGQAMAELRQSDVWCPHAARLLSSVALPWSAPTSCHAADPLTRLTFLSSSPVS